MSKGALPAMIATFAAMLSGAPAALPVDQPSASPPADPVAKNLRVLPKEWTRRQVRNI